MDMRIPTATPQDVDAMHRIHMGVRENRSDDPARLTSAVYPAGLGDHTAGRQRGDTTANGEVAYHLARPSARARTAPETITC